MQITFYGVRGSIPTPATTEHDTRKYGGNTTCLELVTDTGKEYILDAGSGLRLLGNRLLKGEFGKGKGEAKILLSHVHWDHIQGWPFFMPAYIKGNVFDIYGGKKSNSKLEETLKDQGVSSITMNAFSKQQSKFVFPVRLEQMPSTIRFYDIDEGAQISDGLSVKYMKINHPDEAFSYSFEENGKKFVFATDTEHDCEGELGELDRKLIDWSRNADILYYDGQYTPEEYNPSKYGLFGMAKKGWGHSTYEKGADIAMAADIKRLVLGHHDPGHDDAKLDEIELRAKEYVRSKNSQLEVFLAREGVSLHL